MKTLFLLRHAKSSWDDPSLDDADRPLADRGQADAPRLGKAFRKRETPPDRILCSTALRACQTLDLFREAAHLYDLPTLDDRIYGATVGVIVNLLRELPGDTSRVMLVGHNPTFEEAVHCLSGVVHPMPTCALARIDLEVDEWKAVKPGCGRLAWVLTPKSLEK